MGKPKSYRKTPPVCNCMNCYEGQMVSYANYEQKGTCRYHDFEIRGDFICDDFMSIDAGFTIKCLKEERDERQPLPQ